MNYRRYAGKPKTFRDIVGLADSSVSSEETYMSIGSNRITMKDKSTPLLGMSDRGDFKYMMPGGEYEFDGDEVLEMSPDGLFEYEQNLLEIHLSKLKPKEQKEFSDQYEGFTEVMKNTVLTEIFRRNPSFSDNLKQEFMQAGGLTPRFEPTGPDFAGYKLAKIEYADPTDYDRKEKPTVYQGNAPTPPSASSNKPQINPKSKTSVKVKVEESSKRPEPIGSVTPPIIPSKGMPTVTEPANKINDPLGLNLPYNLSRTSSVVAKSTTTKTLAEVVGLNYPFLRVFNHPIYSFGVIGTTSDGDFIIENPKTGQQLKYNHKTKSANVYP